MGTGVESDGKKPFPLDKGTFPIVERENGYGEQ